MPLPCTEASSPTPLCQRVFGCSPVRGGEDEGGDDVGGGERGIEENARGTRVEEEKARTDGAIEDEGCIFVN